LKTYLFSSLSALSHRLRYRKRLTAKFIMSHYRAYGGPRSPLIDQQGIESGGEKASVVLYYYRGNWLKLQGAD